MPASVSSSPGLVRRPFGHLSSGEAVDAFTLSGAGGLSATILSYGGIVSHLLAPDREGRLADVVLGFDELAGYLGPHPYFGAIAGRVAGRIGGARFTLDGVTYSLAPNEAPNHLHGGLQGFDKRLWRATPLARPDGAPSLRLELDSPDGDQGYPGAVHVAVTFTVTADNSLLLDTEARTEDPTPFSLTHHGYFNLGGHDSGTIADHTLQIAASAHAPTDAAMRLLGRRVPVTLENDFRSPRRLGDAIPGLFQQHGDLYFLDTPAAPSAPAAVLAHPPSGRILTVTTDEPCFQLYCGAVLAEVPPVPGKGGARYVRHAGLCLECEGYPDGANTPALGDIILRPGRVLRRRTAYTFSVS